MPTMGTNDSGYVAAGEIYGLIDRIPKGRPDHEAIAALGNIERYARDVAARVASEMFERRRREQA